VRFRYSKVPTRLPVFPQGDVYYRLRPIVEIAVIGPKGQRFVKATVDSGSDDTIFPLALAKTLGIDLTNAPRGRSTAVGGHIFEYPYAEVTLQLEVGGDEKVTWSAIVGFSDARRKLGLLGQSGSFELFNILFLGFEKEVLISPNDSFQGQWVVRRKG
jgi:hypothetical protein